MGTPLLAPDVIDTDLEAIDQGVLEEYGAGCVK